MSIKTEIDDSKHFWALYDVLSFIVICKEEKVSKQRIYGVVKFENYEPCTVFETDNLDDAFMFVFEIDESELKRNKKIQKLKKEMLKHYDEILSFYLEEERRKKIG